MSKIVCMNKNEMNEPSYLLSYTRLFYGSSKNLFCVFGGIIHFGYPELKSDFKRKFKCPALVSKPLNILSPNFHLICILGPHMGARNYHEPILKPTLFWLKNLKTNQFKTKNSA